MILEKINELNKKFLLSSERSSDIVADICFDFEDKFKENDFEKWELTRFYDLPANMKFDELLLFWLFDEKFMGRYQTELNKMNHRYN